MTALVFKAWMLLLYFEYVMRFLPFRRLHQLVRESRVKPATNQRIAHEAICKSVDLACVCYFKQVLCLQRSAATTVLLRNYGWNGILTVGAQISPPEFHAWVEINGKIVNDKPYLRSIYLPLESF